MTLAIEAVGLVKRFGKTLAVDGVDLAVRPGMVLGLLRPNGAGGMCCCTGSGGVSRSRPAGQPSGTRTGLPGGGRRPGPS